MIFSRNLYVAVLVAAMLALGARASLVTSNEVVAAVSAWASANSETFTDKDSSTVVAATPTYDEDGATVLYWTVAMSNGGALIASPDTDLDLVVAVLENYEGSFPEGHPLPAMLKSDMSNRLQALARRRAEARKLRDFAESDRLRAEIGALGYSVEDAPGGACRLKKN